MTWENLKYHEDNLNGIRITQMSREQHVWHEDDVNDISKSWMS